MSVGLEDGPNFAGICDDLLEEVCVEQGRFRVIRLQVHRRFVGSGLVHFLPGSGFMAVVIAFTIVKSTILL